MKKIILVQALALSAMLLSTGCGTSQDESQPQASQAEVDIEVSDDSQEESMPEENPVPDETTEPADTDVVTEIDSSESDTEPIELSVDEFVAQIPSVIEGTIGSGDSFGDISLENGDLLICVTLGDPSPLSYEDLMISRTSSITDAILFLDNCFNLWDTITIDFGEFGSIQNGHDNMQDDGYGAYFRQENFVIISGN